MAGQAKTVELRGKNSQILETIKNSRDAVSFCIKRKVSNRILYLLISTTAARKICMSPAIAHTLPKNSIAALRKTGIKVEIVIPKRGRRTKLNPKIKEMMRKGVGLKEISATEGVPLRSLYNYRKYVEKSGA